MPGPCAESAPQEEVNPFGSFSYVILSWTGACSVSTPIKGSFLLDLESLLHVPQPQRMEALRIVPSSPRGAKSGPETSWILLWACRGLLAQSQDLPGPTRLLYLPSVREDQDTPQRQSTPRTAVVDPTPGRVTSRVALETAQAAWFMSPGSKRHTECRGTWGRSGSRQV